MGVEVEIYLFNLKTYKDRLLPAYKAYFHNNDQAPLLILLEDTCPKLKSTPQLSQAIQLRSEDCEEYIRVLREGIYIYSDKNKGITKTIEVNQKDQGEWARSSIFPALLEALCVPYEREDVYPKLSLSNSAIGNYLSENSELFDDIWTFVHRNRSEALNPSIAETGEILTKEGLYKLNTELERISAPSRIPLKKEYANLCAIVRIALEEPAWALVVTTS